MASVNSKTGGHWLAMRIEEWCMIHHPQGCCCCARCCFDCVTKTKRCWLILTSAWYSPTYILYMISRASSECPTSSKDSVASLPASSIRTSSPPGCYIIVENDKREKVVSIVFRFASIDNCLEVSVSVSVHEVG